jgi:hypothetical protein
MKDPPAGDLDTLLTNGTIREGQSSRGFYTAALYTKERDRWIERTIRTGSDGRFRRDGLPKVASYRLRVDLTRFRVEGINPALCVGVSIHPRARPDVFLVPEKAKAAILKHLKAKPGETVNLGEIHLTRS